MGKLFKIHNYKLHDAADGALVFSKLIMKEFHISKLQLWKHSTSDFPRKKTYGFTAFLCLRTRTADHQITLV